MASPGAPDAIRQALERAGEESPYEMPQEAVDAQNQVRTGKLTVGQLKTTAQVGVSTSSGPT